jgi:hypothetical protein
LHKEGAQLGPKLVSVLVSYGGKMEKTLSDMRVVMGLDPIPETAKGSGRLGGVTPSGALPPSPMPMKDRKEKGSEFTPPRIPSPGKQGSDPGRESTPIS